MKVDHFGHTLTCIYDKTLLNTRTWNDISTPCSRV